MARISTKGFRLVALWLIVALVVTAMIAAWTQLERRGRRDFLVFSELGDGCRIVVPQDPTDHELAAANLLAKAFGRCAGREPERFPIQRGASWTDFLHRTIRLGSAAGITAPQTPLGARTVQYDITPSAVELRAAYADDITFAASWFLERTLGARWFLPGPLGIEIPARDRLFLASGGDSTSPGYLSRELAGVCSNEAGREWRRSNRLDGLLPLGHTAAQMIPPTLLRGRPEFAPLLNGKRFTPFAKGPANWQPDLLARGLSAFVTKKIEAYFAAHPLQVGQAFGLNDSYRFDQSSATLDVVSPPRFFRGRPDYSDLLYKFLNEVAQSVATRSPDRVITTYAYDWTENTPRFQVARNVIPFLTADRSMWFDSEFAANDRALIERWGKAGPQFFGLYDYYYGAPFLVPRPTLWAVTDPIPYAYEKGARAFFAEATPNWALDGPKPWLAAQLLWDPKRDSGALVDEYYTRFWKESAGPMRAFYELCDRQWREQPKPPVWVKYLKDDDQRRLFPPSIRNQLRNHLMEAAKLARSDIVRERVTFVIDAFRVTEAFCAHDEVREELQRCLFDPHARSSDLLAGYTRYTKAREEFIREYRHIRQISPLAIQTASIDDYLRNDPRGRVVEVLAGRGELHLLPMASVAQHFEGRAPNVASLLSPGRELLEDPGWRSLSIKQVHPFTLTDWVERGPWGGKTEPTEFRQIQLLRNADGSQRLRYSGCNQETLWQWRTAKPGHLYRAKVRVSGHVAPGTMVYLLVPFIDKDGRHIGAGHIDRLPAGDWPHGVELEVLVRAPAKAAQIGVSLRTLYQVPGDWTEWETISLREFGP